MLQYMQFVEGNSARDRSGREIVGDARVSALVYLAQIFYLSPVRVLGGFLGLDAVMPVAAPTVSGSLGAVPLTANRAGLGDISIGPALQWNGTSLLGRPLFQRLEAYAILPTGRYDKSFSVNPGSNLITVEPYYALTWLFSQNGEISLRLLYAIHGENDATQTKPGQLFHANYACSIAVHPKLRLGAMGYLLQQTTEDRIAGVPAADSKERAFALGPGLVYTGPGLTLMLSHPIEFGVRNRFSGSRTTLQLLHRF